MNNSRAKIFVVSLVSTVLLSIASLSIAGPFHGKHAMGNPLERMLDHIDLTDQQEEEIGEILKSVPSGKGHKKGFHMMREMIELNPDDVDYLELANEKAEKAGQMMTQHIKAVAKARQDIYAILTEEQKQELQTMIERKMKKMAKRMEDR